MGRCAQALEVESEKEMDYALYCQRTETDKDRQHEREQLLEQVGHQYYIFKLLFKLKSTT